MSSTDQSLETEALDILVFLIPSALVLSWGRRGRLAVVVVQDQGTASW